MNELGGYRNDIGDRADRPRRRVEGEGRRRRVLGRVPVRPGRLRVDRDARRAHRQARPGDERGGDRAVADLRQGSRRAQGRAGVLGRGHRDRAGEHPGHLRRRRRAERGEPVRRLPPGAHRSPTLVPQYVHVGRSHDPDRARPRRPARSPVEPGRRAGRRGAGRADHAGARSAVSSAPARATRAATPTSACSPAPTRRGRGSTSFLTTERLVELLPEAGRFPIDRYRLPEHPLAQLRDPRAPGGRRRGLDPPGRAGQEPRRVVAGPCRRHPRRAARRDVMDFDLPADDDPRRLAVREWLAANPDPTGRQLAEAGYVVPHWPRPWGLDADPMHQLIIDEELQRGRCGAAEQPDRDRMGGADDPAGRHRRAEAALPAADLQRRGSLVSAVQRTRLRFRPGEPRRPAPSATATST